MKVEFTNENEIGYLKRLVQEDIDQLQKKINKRHGVLSNIKFAIERGDF